MNERAKIKVCEDRSRSQNTGLLLLIISCVRPEWSLDNNSRKAKTTEELTKLCGGQTSQKQTFDISGKYRTVKKSSFYIAKKRKIYGMLGIKNFFFKLTLFARLS